MAKPDAIAPLHVKLVAIDTVRPDPANVREHNERNLASAAASLEEFGQQKPIVVDKDGIIRAGNGIWLAAKRLGWPKINVLFTGLSGEAATRYALADNRIGELSYFDDVLLAKQLEEVAGAGLDALGFDNAEFAELLDAATPDDDAGAPPKKMNGHVHQVSVRILVAVSNVEIVERALAATGEANREKALLAVC